MTKHWPSHPIPPSSESAIATFASELRVRSPNLSTLTRFNIKKFVTNQCLEFGVPKMPKVKIYRMNQFLLYSAMTFKACNTF